MELKIHQRKILNVTFESKKLFVSKHFGALLSLGNVDPLGAPQIACAIYCGLPGVLKLTEFLSLNPNCRNSEGIFRSRGRFGPGPGTKLEDWHASSSHG